LSHPWPRRRAAREALDIDDNVDARDSQGQPNLATEESEEHAVRLSSAGVVLCVVLLSVAGPDTSLGAQAGTEDAGPRVGAVVPPFSGTDQFGKTRTLETVLGAKGAMLVFFRSADW
jgi:hypothetical protein